MQSKDFLHSSAYQLLLTKNSIGFLHLLCEQLKHIETIMTEHSQLITNEIDMGSQVP